MSNKQSHCWHYLPVCQAAHPNSEKALHQPKVTGKSNLRVLSLSGTSYLGQGLSWPPFCWARPEDSPGAPGGPRGEGGGMGATGAFPHPSHLASQAPAESRRKNAATRRPRTILQPRAVPQPAHLRALLSGPRSAAPRLPRAQGRPSSRAYGALLPPADLPPPSRTAPGRRSRRRSAEAGAGGER